MANPQHLAFLQLRPWRGMRLSKAEVRNRLTMRINSADFTNVNTFIYELEGTNVSLYPAEHIVQLIKTGYQLEVVRRASIFVRLFEDALALRPLKYPLTLAVDMGDLAKPAEDLPIFSFQKDVGSRVIALPDHEIIDCNYLEAVETDKLSYNSKKNAAFFSGSTTGVANYTLEDLTLQRVPRVRAGRFFKTHTGVDFFLPNVCQFGSEDARNALLAEGFGNGIAISLSEGYNYKFGILMDGNGATCSRTATILRSQSALLKYESPYELFYTAALMPGEHFIPIYQDADVIETVQSELRNPGVYAPIAKRGSAFAQKILSRASILEYTNCILELYTEMFDEYR